MNWSRKLNLNSNSKYSMQSLSEIKKKLVCLNTKGLINTIVPKIVIFYSIDCLWLIHFIFEPICLIKIIQTYKASKNEKDLI